MNEEIYKRQIPTPVEWVHSQFRRGLMLLVSALGIIVVAGCSSSGRSPVAPPPDPGILNYSTNELHEGDVVSITFQYSTNFNAVQKIALDGTLNLNMVGTVTAAGKTVTELQQELAKVYEPLAKGDVITVNTISSGAIVYVSGAVVRPGPMELDRPLTVLEAVMGSGGFDDTRAKLSDVTVLRIVNGRQQAYRVNLNRVLAGREKTPFYLKPYDIIYVPAKVFNY
jgi:polysaccharide export outer membrane protein